MEIHTHFQETKTEKYMMWVSRPSLTYSPVCLVSTTYPTTIRPTTTHRAAWVR